MYENVDLEMIIKQLENSHRGHLDKLNERQENVKRLNAELIYAEAELRLSKDIVGSLQRSIAELKEKQNANHR